MISVSKETLCSLSVPWEEPGMALHQEVPRITPGHEWTGKCIFLTTVVVIKS